jgi:hypothetical protein
LCFALCSPSWFSFYKKIHLRRRDYCTTTKGSWDIKAGRGMIEEVHLEVLRFYHLVASLIKEPTLFHIIVAVLVVEFVTDYDTLAEISCFSILSFPIHILCQQSPLLSTRTLHGQV